MSTGAGDDRRDAMQRAANDGIWSGGDWVEAYANRTLRPVEALILVRYRDGLSGRVLELGSGAGRLTGYLTEISDRVHGIDISPHMVTYSREHYPRATFEHGDIRDLSGFATCSWDAVVAAYNVIDVLGEGARSELLDSVFRLLTVGGLFVMSSHNRAIEGHLGDPLRTPSRSLGERLRTYLTRRRRQLNRRRLVPYERSEPGYAILNDAAHDFAALHYYITRDLQQTQLEAHGFELVECLDLEGNTVERGEVSQSPELHYVARRRESIA